MTCATCRYADFESHVEINKAAGDTEQFRGICRRFPPSMQVIPTVGPYIYVQPLVYRRDFCGEYTPDDEPEEATRKPF